MGPCPKGGSIHRRRVMPLMKQALYPQATTIGVDNEIFCFRTIASSKKLIFPICYPGTSAESSCGEEKASPKSTATTLASTPESGKPPSANSSSKADEQSDTRTAPSQDSVADRVEIGQIPVSDLKEPINSSVKQQLNSETSSSCGSCGSNTVSDQNFAKG